MTNPLNARFRRVCQSLQIDVGKDDDPRASRSLIEAVHGLISHPYGLRGGRVAVVDEGRNKGPAKSLERELDGKGNKLGTLTPASATRLAHWLHGFLQTEEGVWDLPPEPVEGESVWSASVAGIIPPLVRERIAMFHHHRRAELDHYLARTIDYLAAPHRGLPTPPWEEPYEVTRAHELIREFLRRAESARSDITMAGVDFYLTMSIGRLVLLDRLEKGVRLRVLVFDFLHGDTRKVARLVGRSRDTLCVLVDDTVEALLWLGEQASERASANLEVRLTRQDPQGRWYLVDVRKDRAGVRPYAFIVSRASAPGGAPKKTRKAADTPGAFEVLPTKIDATAGEVEKLWASARPFDTWLPEYRRWRASKEGKRIRGED